MTEAEAGLLLPGLLGQDAFNLLVGLPFLLGSLWLAHRGSLIRLLFWPGVLFDALCWYVLYLTGAPFSLLLLASTLFARRGSVGSLSKEVPDDAEEIPVRQEPAKRPRRATGDLAAAQRTLP